LAGDPGGEARESGLIFAGLNRAFLSFNRYEVEPVGWVERSAKPTHFTAAMGFVTIPDMRLKSP
jgi:hypothetical protein